MNIVCDDTIAALATPPGCGGIGVVRISGHLASAIAEQILGKLPKPRYATFSNFLDDKHEIIDQGVALFFNAPNSFTGEDVLELQGHGGSVVLDCLLKRILDLGARMARPGEFSERAFLNGKIDLTQAEAIADLIDAASVQATKYAMCSLQGEFSRHIKILTDAIINLRKYVEAAIDFPEQEINFLKDTKIGLDLQDVLKELTKVQDAAYQGTLLSEGIAAVIAGKPNVGKSSLLNRLSAQDAAIVTDIPGTTRDILRTQINVDGIPIHLLDTAGLCEGSDVIEQEGVRRAWQEIDKADIVLLVIDASIEKVRDPQKLWPEFFSKLPAQKKFIVVYNKIDLTGENPRSLQTSGFNCLFVSAKTGDGLSLLKKQIKISVGFNVNQGEFSARRRHLEALKNAKQHLLTAVNSLQQKYCELLAEDLRGAHLALQEITGEFSSQDLLDLIFSEFCIGK